MKTSAPPHHITIGGEVLPPGQSRTFNVWQTSNLVIEEGPRPAPDTAVFKAVVEGIVPMGVAFTPVQVEQAFTEDPPFKSE